MTRKRVPEPAQETLFGTRRYPTLTTFQEEALVLVRDSPGGMKDVELGRAIHARRDAHTAEATCAYCARDGRHMLKALRTKGLVVRRHSGQWQALDEQKPKLAVVSSQSSELPDGY